jgi:hypothetical protein
MSDLYSVDIFNSSIGEDGVVVHLTKGRPITVEGEPHVRTTYGSVVPARAFFPTLAEAHLAAAGKIEEMARRLTDQAARMRAEATKEK